MLKKSQNHIIQNFPFLMEKKLLIAVSGGLDSMVLLHLFEQMNCKIAVAHCNFQLRGNENFDDENFVKNYSDKNQIPVFITQFDTENYAQTNKLSIQVAARNLRYDWFYELLETEKFDYILTAHHADDNLESFFINLSRGSGIDGLLGIPQQNDKIIRPLLHFSRQEIEDYAAENQIIWREDSSNSSDKYLRNKIRQQLIPVLKDLNPQFLDSFRKSQKYLQETQNLTNEVVKIAYEKIVNQSGNEIHFDIKKLKEFANYKSYLYQFLNKYGFSAWDDIYDLIDGQTGKQVFSNEYLVLKNRDFLILSPKIPECEQTEFYIEKEQNEVNFPVKLSISKVEKIDQNSKNTIFIDADKVSFPLIIKKWEEGTIFQPFGMGGNSKKISKFFKDEKLSLLEKQNIWILYYENQVVWIIGMRQDERFKICESTKNILRITIN